MLEGVAQLVEGSDSTHKTLCPTLSTAETGCGDA